MTLFVYLATPLFVLAVVARAGPGEAGREETLLPWFAGAALLALPLYPPVSMLAEAFPPYYQPRLLYLQLLAVDHGAPLAAALLVSLLLRRYRNGRSRRRSGLLHRATLARGQRPPQPRSGTGRRSELPHLLVTLGGFFSMFAILEQLSYQPDPSFYRLILLPLLRLALVSAAAYLLARTAEAGVWWRVAVLPALLALPLLTAAIAYGDVIRRPYLAAAGSTMLFAAALLPVLRYSRTEVPHGNR